VFRPNQWDEVSHIVFVEKLVPHTYRMKESKSEHKYLLSLLDGDEQDDVMASISYFRGYRVAVTPGILERSVYWEYAAHQNADTDVRDFARFLMNETGGDSDIYESNLMFRRTKNGLQMVINDPICS
jgi:hypothetical protein